MSAGRPDWGAEDQRLAELNRRVGRRAFMAELLILGVGAIVGAVAAPVLVENIVIGLIGALGGGIQ